MSVRDEHPTLDRKKPSDVLRKTKSPDAKGDKDDDKKTDKAPRKNALLAFIADHKKSK